ncbi:oligosaccharide flippase family protein [Phocaeicola faecalis]|uniref:oligosaccharide flippase family protein n=1 Tax=Phocaeicola faecalis TaxID=2786956 RepID=UPI001F178565|nr:oligosaccharide flippase family protein [Phocaeicola faecalis]
MAVSQLKVGAVLSYVAIGLNIVIGLLYTPYMLRTLGQNEYGLYSLVASVVSYLTVLDFGFGNAIVRYTAKYKAEGKEEEQYEMFGMFLILYSVIGLISIVGGALLYENIGLLFDATMPSDDLYKVKIMMLLMIFNMAFTFPMSIWKSIITAYEKFIFNRVVNLARIILNPLVMVILLAVGYKAITMVVVITLFNVFSLIADAWYCKNRLHIKIKFARFKWNFLKEVGAYSFWIFLNCIMDRIYWSTGQLILGIFKGAAEVAVYAVAIQLEHMYMMFSTAISSVFLPKITTMVVKGNNEKEISNLFIKSGRVQYIIMVFILVVFIVFGHSFILLWAGSDYANAYWITLCLFVPLIIPLIQNLGIIILQAKNQMKFRSILYIIIAIVSLGISIPLARLYGGIGCAIGTALALIAGQIIAMNIYYQRIIHLDILKFWNDILKMSVVPVIFGFIGTVVIFYFGVQFDIITLIMGVVLFSIVYLPLFWKFSMNDYERSLFRSPINIILSKIGVKYSL